MVKHLFLSSWSYVTLQDIGKARWRAKRTLPGCPGDSTLRSERRCHHTGVEGAAIRSTLPFRCFGRQIDEDRDDRITRRTSKEGDSAAIEVVIRKQRDGGSADHLQRQNE